MGARVSLGIDLGTTNSSAAVFQGEGVTLVRSAAGSPLTPSVVRYDSRGNVTVGERARRHLDTDPGNTRSEFKRLMGTAHTLEFPAARLVRRPEELAAEVLRALRKDVEAQLGVAPVQAVVTVPALFELPQSRATAEAARLAGFSRVELLQEPVASAIAAGWTADAADARPWLVYDLGGGTFDASLLETHEGILRVVGHDGDNFLGGRDVDAAVVAWVLERLREEGYAVDAGDPRHAVGLRRLRHLAEEVKIELSRADRAVLTLPAAFDLDGPVDVDVELDRAGLDARIAALVDRSVAVCRRLCAAHGIRTEELARVVLVGGPTLMPGLRERVAAGLGAPFAPGLDPMTLVAQGAALFAAASHLDAAPAPVAVPVTHGVAVWLQYPALTADVTPVLVGRVLEPGAVDTVRASRDGWTGEAEPVEADGSFVLPLELRPRSANAFTLEARRAGTAVPLRPPGFDVIHGLTLQDPPLSRTVGVARSDGSVHVYFPRGSPLPIRRSFTLTTVETLIPGQAGQVLQVPIVQGELGSAHLCRLVGTLEIAATALSQPLRAGSPIEVSLEMDRGGKLSARATLPDGKVFDDVAQLVAPAPDREAMIELASGVRARLARARDLVGAPDARVATALAEAGRLLDEVQALLRLARGGDADAAEKARRALLEADAEAATVELAAAWPELTREVEEATDNARGWVGRYASDSERAAFEDAVRRARAALQRRSEAEVNRLIRVIEDMGEAAFVRWPGAWPASFAWWRARAGDATDARAAQAAVRDGEAALQRNDTAGLRAACEALARLLPAHDRAAVRARGSGVR